MRIDKLLSNLKYGTRNEIKKAMKNHHLLINGEVVVDPKTNVDPEVDKIVFLAYEVTKEKELELSIHNQHQKLKEREDSMRIESLDLKKHIGELKIAREKEKLALELELHKYIGVLDINPDPIVVINNQGLLLFINKSASKIWKINRKNLKDSGVHLLFASQQEDPAMQAFVDPGKQIVEQKVKMIKIILSDRRVIEKKVSIIETASGSELIQTLIIHD